MTAVDAYGLLVEEFKMDEVCDQLVAAKRINTIAINMGPDRSRSQLLPFLRLVSPFPPPKNPAEYPRAAPSALREVLPRIWAGDLLPRA